jgi:type I restriction enzyme S subunit
MSLRLPPNQNKLPLPNFSLFGLPVPVPPINEQQEILDHADTLSSKIAMAIARKHNEIEKLKEYNATLMNSTVTGKIKIPTVNNPEGMQ